MKKRDLYFAIVLLSVVGYAASVRMKNNANRAARENQLTKTEEIASQGKSLEIAKNKLADSIKWVETPKSERLSSSALMSK